MQQLCRECLKESTTTKPKNCFLSQHEWDRLKSIPPGDRSEEIFDAEYLCENKENPPE